MTGFLLIWAVVATVGWIVNRHYRRVNHAARLAADKRAYKFERLAEDEAALRVRWEAMYIDAAANEALFRTLLTREWAGNLKKTAEEKAEQVWRMN